MRDIQDNGRRRRGEQRPESRKRTRLNAIRHGGYARAAVPLTRHCPERPVCRCPGDPDLPCPVFAEAARRLLQELGALPHLRREHQPLLGEYVSTFIRIQVLDRFLQRVGLVRVTAEGLNTHPVVYRLRGHLSHLLARLSDQLGLNPISAKTLGVTDPIDVGGDLLAQLRQEARPSEEDAE